MRLRALITCATTTLFLEACYVPPFWDTADTINRLDWIEEGVTTKAEVLKRLGKPAFRIEDQNSITYTGHKSRGLIVIGGGYTADAALIGEKFWWVDIYFDERNTVAFLVTSEMRNSRRDEAETKAWIRILKARAEKGDAEAQFRLYNRLPPSDEHLKYLCLSANQGHALAQEALGDLNLAEHKSDWRMEGKGKPNKVKAFVWYGLAASNHLKRAEFLRDQLSQDMTDQEIAEAERLVAEWRPNPAECGETSAQLND